jgi:hypothetical protein
VLSTARLQLSGQVADRLLKRDGGREADRRSNAPEIRLPDEKIIETRRKRLVVGHHTYIAPRGKCLNHEIRKRADRDGLFATNVEDATMAGARFDKLGKYLHNVADIAKAA